MAYQTVIIIATMLTAFVTNGRIAWFLGRRWGLSVAGDVNWWDAGCAIVGAAAFYYISLAFFQYGGLLAGVIGIFACIPISGAVWIFVVGGNKAIERILSNLMKKVDSVSSN